MMNSIKQPRWWAGLFFLIILLELIGEASVELLDNPNLVYLTKPLMMPMLALYFYYRMRPSPISRFSRFILAALFFSWLGDLLLMVTWTGPNLFLYGLGAFLVAHLMYINGFRIVPGGQTVSLLRKRPYAALPVILYCAGLVYGLHRYGGETFEEMQFPVALYAGVILIMVLTALNRINRVADRSFQLVFWGALSFMFSDSLIAVNKFTDGFTDSPILVRVLIMATYALGQFLIVEGCAQQITHDESPVSNGQ
jgi:uncharacterized membrane protein YhhN